MDFKRELITVKKKKDKIGEDKNYHKKSP